MNMGNGKNTYLGEELDEQLTAYLDGELAPREASELEKRLVHDEGVRIRLAELRSAYDYLDDLPETPHDQRFTQSTIEHVVHQLQGPELDKANPHLSMRRSGEPLQHSKAKKTGWSAVVGRATRRLLLAALCIALGTVCGLFARGISIRKEIRELSLNINLSGLRDVSDISVAEALSQDEVAVKYVKKRFERRFVPNVPGTKDELTHWFHSLEPTQKAEISRGRAATNRLQPSDYERLSQLENAIHDLPQPQSAQEAVRATGLVMESLMNAERLALSGMSADERITYLREQLYSVAAAYYFAESLTDAEKRAIREWFDEDFKYEMASSIGGFTNLDRDSNNENRLINRFAYAMLRWEDSQFQPWLTQVKTHLTDEGRALLDPLPPAKQMMILFDQLAPNRESFQFVERYEQLPASLREQLDLGDPSNVSRGSFPGRGRPPGR